MSTIKVEIVSAEENVWSGEGTMVFAPGIMGELGIAPRHTPLITQLKPGDVRVITEDGKEAFFFISGGILEVQPDVVTVLSDTAIRADDLDEAKALAAQKKAEETMRDQGSEMDYARAKAELIQIAAQLRSIEKIKNLRR
ncbi:MAG: F0F1 ATP synthase subunit epsilon [Arenicellales bacterium]